MSVLLHALAVLALAADPISDDPVVLAKGKGFIVHGLSGAKPLELTPASAPSPSAILYTALPSGKTRTLFRGGSTASMLPPMAIDRWDVSQKRVAAVAADAERLYVLVWSASWRHEDFGGKGLVVGKPPESDRYTLRAYWLEDGSEITAVALRGKRPKGVPAERLDKGPLEVKDGAVTVFGEVIRYKGKKRPEGR